MKRVTRPARGVVATVLASQALRGLGYGLAAVQLGAVLRGQGLGAPGVGLVLAAIVAGSATTSLALGRWGDRIGRARAYGLLYAALAVTNTARYVTRPAGPVLAGLLQPLGLAIPFLIAGITKSAYDLALWRLFRPIRLPADTATTIGGAA